MRLSILVLSALTVCSAEDNYNILALDGGGIRGIITATVIDKIELYAY